MEATAVLLKPIDRSAPPAAHPEAVSPHSTAIRPPEPGISSSNPTSRQIINEAVEPKPISEGIKSPSVSAEALVLNGKGTSLTETFQTRRTTKDGKHILSSRLSQEGKRVSGALFNQLTGEGFDVQSILTSAKEGKKAEAESIKKTKDALRAQAKVDYAAIKKSTPKDQRADLPKYKDVIAKIIANDQDIQQAKVRQKILNSMAMHARIEIRKELTTKVREEILSQERDGKIQGLTEYGKFVLAKFQESGKTIPISLRNNALIQYAAKRPELKETFLKEQGEKKAAGSKPISTENQTPEPASIVVSAEQEIQVPLVLEQAEQILAEKQAVVEAQPLAIQKIPEEIAAEKAEAEVQAYIAEVRRASSERADMLKQLTNARKHKRLTTRGLNFARRALKGPGKLVREAEAALDAVKKNPALAVVTIGGVIFTCSLFSGLTALTPKLEAAGFLTPTIGQAAKQPDAAGAGVDISFGQEAPKPQKEQVKKVYDFQSEYFGIRHDLSDNMDQVGEIGAKTVRINGGSTELIKMGTSYKLKDNNLEKALIAAKENELNILYLFDSGISSISKDEVAKRVKYVTENYPNVILEIGNEMDDPSIRRWGSGKWTNEDKQNYARFIKNVTEEAWKINPNQKIVVGALVEEKNIVDLVDYLKKEGVDIKRLIYGIHLYDLPREVKDRVEMVKKATDGAEVYFTEVGSGRNDVGVTLSIVREARKYSKLVVVHQLIEYPEERIENGRKVVYHFGYFNQEKKEKTTRFDRLLNGVKQIERDMVN